MPLNEDLCIRFRFNGVICIEGFQIDIIKKRAVSIGSNLVGTQPFLLKLMHRDLL